MKKQKEYARTQLQQANQKTEASTRSTKLQSERIEWEMSSLDALKVNYLESHYSSART